MVLKKRKICKNLSSKGFEEDRSKDHIYFRYYHNGKKTRYFTKLSHGGTEITDSLINVMARQLQLKKAEFVNLVECSLSKEELLEIYIEKGL